MRPAAAQNPPGTEIPNTATATWSAGTRDGLSTASNRVDLTVVPVRSAAALEFMRHRPGLRAFVSVPVAGTMYSASGLPAGPYLPSPGPTSPVNGALDLDRPVPLATADVYFQDEPLFLRLVDPDRNLDAGGADTILLVVENPALADRELLRLTETGPGTGEFLGYLQTTGSGRPEAKDGLLAVRQNDTVTASYADADDASDQAFVSARIDPVGRVFDARTGEPVPGATVRLVDDASGDAATVLGNDATSLFPATVTTGSAVTDDAGAVYDFGPGGYRFPHVAPGLYRLVVDAPPGYRAPSRLADAALQALPGAPWVLAAAASRGAAFATDDAPLLVDIPLDPVDTDLFVSKTAGRTSAAVGDFVPYEIKVTNAASDDATDLTITDRLPAGFRFRPGSVLIDGTAAADPTVSADGRTLVFARPDLPAGASVALAYVAAVVPGARAGDAVNMATATWAGRSSNEATALVTVRRDLFGSTATVLGRVTGRACDDPADTLRGIPGVRVLLETGAFAVTDAAGRYHLVDIAPGAHLVQLDRSTLPEGWVPGDCSGDTLYDEHPWSRLVDLQGGTVWQNDFRLRRLPRAEGVVELGLDTSLRGDAVAGRVIIEAAADVPLRDLRLTVQLADGTAYVTGSSRRGARPVPDPAGTDGVLVYRLDELAAGSRDTLHFTASVLPPLRRSELPFQALLTCTTPARDNVRTEVVRTVLALIPETARIEQPEVVLRPRFASLRADLGPADLAAIDSLVAGLAGLDVVAVRVVGHSDSQRIRPGAHPVYTDNLVLSEARARAVAERVATGLGLDPARLSVYGVGPREPVADNATADGRALNRRVALRIWTEKTVPRLSDQEVRDHAAARLPVQGFRPGEDWPAPAASTVDTTRMPAYDAAWLATAPEGDRILWPRRGHLPAIPAVKLAVQHAATDSVLLEINGVRGGERNLLGRATGPAGLKAVTMWTGLDLQPGGNVLAALLVGPDGRVRQRLERHVHLSGSPVFAEFMPTHSRLVADGRTRPLVAVRLTDAAGQPARRDVVGRFDVAPPHEAWRAPEDADRETVSDLAAAAPTYAVGADGIALLPLAPTTTAGEAVLRLELRDNAEELRVWLAPAARDWVLAGVMEGTAAYSAVSGNLETLDQAGRHEEFHADGRLAFYAKGRLKGRWLLTMAYDSRDPDPDRREGLAGAIDPDAYYTVYGDASTLGHDAATRDHLYVKLERERFYALYGDHATGLTMTDLSRYARTLTGLRSSRRGDRLDVDVFAAETDRNFRRDEIPGDGTSGPYRLSSRQPVPGSVEIVLQTRDRFRSEIITSERSLARGVDYTLDELEGLLFFRQPVSMRDASLDPVWIVASYETAGGGASEITAGGRAAWKPVAGVEVGATGVREGTSGGGADVLLGLDGRWDVSPEVRLEAEVAGSDVAAAGERRAWRGEVVKRAGAVQGRLYAHEREDGFGLGHQNAAEAGQRKIGLESRWLGHDHWRGDLTAFTRRDLVRGDERHFLQLKVDHERGPWRTGLGMRAVNDERQTGVMRTRQLTAEAALRVWGGRGRVRLGREQSLTGGNEATDLPTRTSLGAEWEVLRDQKIFLAQELVDRGGPADHRTRLGASSVPWRGAKLTSAAEHHGTESGRRVFASMGLQQSLRLDDHWLLDGTVDHGSPAAGAFADTGSIGYTAATVGATWRRDAWFVNQRIEYRTGGGTERWGLATGAHVEPREGLGLLAALRWSRNDGPTTGRHSRADATVGLALRPDDSPWAVLQRLSWRAEDKDGPTPLSTWHVVHNLNVSRRLGGRDQVSALLGLRFNRDTIAGRRYEGLSDQLGLEWRHFWGSRWDAGLRGSTRHAWREGVVDWSAGISCGYKVLEDIWLSLGYNVAGYADRDFGANDHTAQGPYLRFRVRFNEEVTRAVLR